MNINPSFKLRDSESSGPTSLILFLFYNGRRFKYGTGIQMYPDLWVIPKDNKGYPSHEDARPSTKKSDLAKYRHDHPNINAEIESIKNKLDLIRQQVFEIFRQNPNPSKDEITQSLNLVCSQKVHLIINQKSLSTLLKDSLMI